MSSLREQREKAERELKLNEVYENALDAKNVLAEAVAALATLRSEKREFEMALAEREADVAQETWAENSDLPVTRLDKLVKVNVQSDQMAKVLRIKINQLSLEIDSREGMKSVAEADIRISTARMNELQGMLNFTVALMQNKKE